jgi:hypothetical protein
MPCRPQTPPHSPSSCIGARPRACTYTYPPIHPPIPRPSIIPPALNYRIIPSPCVAVPHPPARTAALTCQSPIGPSVGRLWPRVLGGSPSQNRVPRLWPAHMAGALASPMHDENNVQQQPLVPRCSNVHPAHPIRNGEKGSPRLLLLPPLLIYRTSPSRPQSPAPPTVTLC